LRGNKNPDRETFRLADSRRRVQSRLTNRKPNVHASGPAGPTGLALDILGCLRGVLMAKQIQCAPGKAEGSSPGVRIRLGSTMPCK